MLFLSPATVSADEIFKDLVEMNQVESSYVSGRFAGTKKVWRSSNGIRAVDLSQGFSALYSYQCYSIQSVEEAKRILKNYLKKNSNIQLMLRTKQGTGEYCLYEDIDKENRVRQMIIWNMEAPNVCEIVVVDWKNGLEKMKPYKD